MNDNDDLKQELNNENIEAPKTNDVTPTTITPVVQDELKSNNQAKNTNINMTPKKKSNMKAGTKTQLIILAVTLIFWIFLASAVISFIRSIGRGLKRPKNYYTQVNYDTNQVAPQAQTTVVEPVTTTEVAPPVENTPVTTVPEPVNNITVPQSIPETNNNVAPQQNTVNQVQNTQQYSAYDDYDLQVLEQVYDEVINRGNESYLYNFSSSELAIIRNTLYARRGYRFKKKKYQQYFGSKPWYTPTTDSQNILPKNEERLANIIKKYE
ncbi:YARHG domain-containing protein [Fusobacterium pseudoperiodonticum]|uniref:Serine/threonine protein kinase n=1 Tax=Fusobacterium pseudoperiodonticum TaxID=2663009 RepID=A0A2G9EJ60_9FUSO|nr:YARHG domain-containing protein [Fusobacterium pseudoperiodonticum]PIM80344.1 serine/threonine protein kinase [Fusobacterium pseudoperiodonticum]